ncbi:MAG: hypothetical protein DRP76_03575 [Candidatus Omnitrophota bacterium]|nr:MAG: hypothetical protein DRP76_03575 [Candidatus Omnitrophota bacterium]
MKVVILGKNEVIYDGMAKEVVLPGEDGEFAVLDFHQSFFYRLKEGSIYVDRSDVCTIKDGVARMRGNELVILVKR